MEFQFESLGPTLRVIVLIFMLVFAMLLIGFVLLLAALPGRIARTRKHPQAAAVNVCGWVGLPTGILWAVAMVWAFWVDRSQADALASWSVDLSQQLDGLERSLSALESQR